MSRARVLALFLLAVWCVLVSPAFAGEDLIGRVSSLYLTYSPGASVPI